MTQANKKFQQLKRGIHAKKAREYQREKVKGNVEKADVDTRKYKCHECGKVIYYKASECTDCFSKDIVEADKTEDKEE